MYTVLMLTSTTQYMALLHTLTHPHSPTTHSDTVSEDCCRVVLVFCHDNTGRVQQFDMFVQLHFLHCSEAARRESGKGGGREGGEGRGGEERGGGGSSRRN